MAEVEIMVVAGVVMGLRPVLAMVLPLARDIMVDRPILVAMTDRHGVVGGIDTGEGVVEIVIGLPEISTSSRRPIPVSVWFAAFFLA